MSLRPVSHTRSRMSADWFLPVPVKLCVMLDTSGMLADVELVRAFRIAPAPTGIARHATSGTSWVSRARDRRRHGRPLTTTNAHRSATTMPMSAARCPLRIGDRIKMPHQPTTPKRGAALQSSTIRSTKPNESNTVAVSAPRRLANPESANSGSETSRPAAAARIGARDASPTIHADLAMNDRDTKRSTGTPATRIAMPPASSTNFVWKSTSTESCPFARPSGAARRKNAKKADHRSPGPVMRRGNPRTTSRATSAAAITRSAVR